MDFAEIVLGWAFTQVIRLNLALRLMRSTQRFRPIVLGVLTQIHAGERIIPAADNRALMSAVGVGAGGGSRAAGHTINNHFSPTIHAHTPPSLESLLNEQGGDMISFIHASIRSGRLKLG